MVREHASSSRTALLGGARCKGPFSPRRCELQQFRHGFDIPIRVLRLRVAEIGAELDHLAVGIKPLAVPPHDRPDREGVPEIMDARAAPMFAEALRRAQTEILADDREVVACATISRTLATFDHEERGGA